MSSKKQQGAPTSCAEIIKSTSLFLSFALAEAVSGNDSVIEMHDLLWLKQMDTRLRERQMTHKHARADTHPGCFEPIVLIMLASMASNRGRPYSPSF